MKSNTIQWMAAGALAFAMVSCSSYYEAHLAGAEAGKAEDQYAIGTCYYDGTAPGGAINKTKAAEWFTKAAQQGDAKAQNKLGLMYEKGEGVPQDDDKAFHWLKQAALQGYSEAQYNLGKFYQNLDQSGGFDIGSEEHFRYVKLESEAAKWYRMAAEQNHAEAQHKLGLIYIRGARNNYRKYDAKYNLGGDINDVQKYRAMGLEWLRKAAAQGDPTHVKIYQWHIEDKYPWS